MENLIWLWGRREEGGAVKGKWRDKTQTDRQIAWWTERQPQGLTFSLHEFPHVSISHLFPVFCGSHLFNTPSPDSLTGSNNSLENIYLVKVAKSHVVVGVKMPTGQKRLLCFLRCENNSVAFSDGEDELQNGSRHKKKVWCPFKKNGKSYVRVICF